MPADHPGFLHCLSDELVMRLVAVGAEVRRMVEHLVSANAVARVLGLDAIYDCVLRDDAPVPMAEEALPFLFALAESPRYAHASAILTRLASVLGTLDDPPRGLAREEDRRARPEAARLWDLFHGRVGSLQRVARSSPDPVSCRVAARMLVHFPDADAALVPVLFALLTGASDPEERAPLSYALARIQAEGGRPLHPRLARALEGGGGEAERRAVTLALEHARGP